MSPYKYFTEIIEDAAIDITVHIKSDIQVMMTILDAREDALDFLYNKIEDLDNKNIYKTMIEKLVEYCLIIIDTDWEDTNKYSKHITFIENYQQKFKREEPYINYKERPLGKIPLDIQENILKIKYNKDIKYYKRFIFLLNYTNPLLDYLKEKKEWSTHY